MRPEVSSNEWRLCTGFLFVCIAALGALLAPISSLAATAYDRPLLKTFDGSDTNAGKFVGIRGLDVDQSSGAVYVLDAPFKTGSLNVVNKFNADGEAQKFSASGTSSLEVEIESTASPNNTDISVDNASPKKGRFYVTTSSALAAFGSTGDLLAQDSIDTLGTCRTAVDTDGHLWVLTDRDGAWEYDTSGASFDRIGEVPITSGSNPCGIGLDADGDLYVGTPISDFLSPPGGRLDRYVGGVFASTVAEIGRVNAIRVDQSKSDGHIFANGNGMFMELTQSGIVLGEFGIGIVPGGNNSLAYNPTLDRVYIGTQSKTVQVFGPLETLGTVPDVAIEPTSSGSVATAHVSGTINPLGLDHGYYFEYKRGVANEWGSAKKTPIEQIEPSDNETHEVSADLTGLEPFTTYKVRLVATNDKLSEELGKEVKSVSTANTFRTGRSATVAIGEPAAVTAHTVELEGEVDPQDSKTSWRFQISFDLGCASGKGFVNGPSHSIEANTGLTPVEEERVDLSPNQHYCVRLVAENSPGTVTSAIKQFTTDPLPPIVTPRGAAPRTETGARLNAFVDTQNAPTTYHFEYSTGGGSWTVLPDHELTAAKAGVLVSEELTGLKPATIYQFKVSATNLAGTAQSEAQAFATLAGPSPPCPNEDVRSAQHATYLPDCRGIELVNNPDKGTQNVLASGPAAGGSPLSADGGEVLWGVLAGAPGAPNGTTNTFLATRSAGGWTSRPVAPPADEQLEGGELAYELLATTPSLSAYVFNAKRSTGASAPEPPSLVRVLSDRSQEVLKRYEVQPPNSAYEKLVQVSDDGAHVIFPDNKSLQLEDVGDPGSEPETISLMPDGQPSACGLNATANGMSFAGAGDQGYHWIATTDASRVYFQAPANGSCAGPYGLYVRNREAATTTLIDPGAAGKEPRFIRATPDGLAAYFISHTQLDPADENDDADVYRWDEAEGEASCLTCLVEDANVSGEAMVSDDFSRVYFESTEKLIAGLGVQGEVNLYVLSGGELGLVGVVGANVLNDDTKLSASGEVLLFKASASQILTTDAVAVKCAVPGDTETGLCRELYRYDDGTGGLECISCDRAGLTTHSAGSPSGREGIHFQLSADGSTAAFATQEALVTLDVNNDTDIYRWRDGAYGLITDGVSDLQEELTAPQVLAIDENGSDILFGLVPPGGSLTGFERDELLNLYDARVGGGFEPPSPPAHCVEDSCQGPLLAPPSAEQPSSATFAGRGNETSTSKPRRPCARKRGKAKRRCMRRYRGPSRQARAHHDSGRAK